MKLQKQLSRKIGNAVYSKWAVTIPPKKIEEIGWKEGQELDIAVKNGVLLLKPKKK